MSNHDPDKFYLGISDHRLIVPEEPQGLAQPFTRYADALAEVSVWAVICRSDLTPEIHNLGTVTGDGSKGIGATELATVLSCWRLDDGRYISLYQVQR